LTCGVARWRSAWSMLSAIKQIIRVNYILK
jgi:hypothetical protein